MSESEKKYRGVLRALFNSAIDAVSARRVLPAALPAEPAGRTVLLAVGKAAASMAEIVLDEWQGPITGLVVTRYGHSLPALGRHKNIEVIEAGHPVPDENSVAGARRALEFVRDLGADDLVLVLISGGGSALWCLPLDPVTLADKQRITRALLGAGASIRELNTVRKWFSGIKGGQLAGAAAPARVETLIISDVVDNSPGMIASGPTCAPEESFVDLTTILARYRLELPEAFLQAARESAAHRTGFSPDRCRSRVVAVPTDALEAAKGAAASMGYTVHSLGDRVEGEARDAARAHAQVVQQFSGQSKPVIILSGGEVTVTVRDGSGVGGPNTEFLLALALELNGHGNVFALACDTDGYDGVGDSAGAIITPDTIARAREMGLDARASLEGNDSHTFFAALGDLVTTGPTQTNVSDFRAIVIGTNR